MDLFKGLAVGITQVSCHVRAPQVHTPRANTWDAYHTGCKMWLRVKSAASCAGALPMGRCCDTQNRILRSSAAVGFLEARLPFNSVTMTVFATPNRFQLSLTPLFQTSIDICAAVLFRLKEQRSHLKTQEAGAQPEQRSSRNCANLASTDLSLIKGFGRSQDGLGLISDGCLREDLFP